MLWWTLRQLRSKDSWTRAQAARKLGESKDTRAVESLIVALTHDESRVREAIVESLGKIEDDRAVEPLVASAIRDEYIAVRETAVSALMKIRNPRSVELLVAALKDRNSKVRKAAEEVLGEIAPTWMESEIAKAAVPSMLELLSDEDSELLHDIVSVLGQIKDRRAVEPLVTMLTSECRRVRYAVMRALTQIGWRPFNLNHRVILALFQGDWVSLVNIGSSVVEPLLAALKDADEIGAVRSNAAKALGEIGDARAVEPLMRHLSYESCEVVIPAIEALGKIRYGVAIEPIINALVDECAGVRGEAAKALQKIDPKWVNSQAAKEAVLPLLEALANKCKARHYCTHKRTLTYVRRNLLEAPVDSSDGLRCDAAWALGQIGDSRAVEPLIARLCPKNRPSKAFERSASKALIEIGRSAVEPLTVALKNDDWQMRTTAAMILGEIGDTRAVGPLIAALKDGTDIALKKILTKSGATSAAVPWVIGVLKDVDTHARRAAADLLGELGDSRAVEPLTILLKDEESQVRQSAAKALGKIRDMRAVVPLVAILKDKDISEREIATWALGEIGDISAVEPLIAMLEEIREDSWSIRLYESATAALGQIGDASAVGALITLAHDGKVAEVAIRALYQVLEKSASGIKSDDLRIIADLENVPQIRYRNIGGSHCAGTWTETYMEQIDCSYMRQLARQELIRRGLKA